MKESKSTHLKDEENLLKMYEHGGKAYSDGSEEVTNGGLQHHEITFTSTKNKEQR